MPEMPLAEQDLVPPSPPPRRTRPGRGGPARPGTDAPPPPPPPRWRTGASPRANMLVDEPGYGCWAGASLRQHGELAAFEAAAFATAAELGPNDYHGTGGENRVATLLELGVVRLARGDALLELAGHRDGLQMKYRSGRPLGCTGYEFAATGECGVLPRRQDAHGSLFHPPAYAAKMWRQSHAVATRKSRCDLGMPLGAPGLWLHSVSYCWTTLEHPDPDGFHLRRLAAVLARLRYLRQFESEAHRDDPALLDVGVFWDFVSLPQKHGGGRTELEHRQFRLAIADMQLLYGHAQAVVLKLQRMPRPPQTLGPDQRFESMIHGVVVRLAWEYGDRGWPFFESSVANTNMAVAESRLEFPYEDDRLAELLREVHSWRALQHDFGFTRSPPLHPEEFGAALAGKTFTNGSDRGVVTELYCKTFANVAQGEVLDLSAARFEDSVGPQLFRALTEFKQLQTLNLSLSLLVSLPAGIGRLTKLRTLDLQFNRLAALPVEIGRLTALQELHLSDNQIVAVPPEIGKLISLQRLNLANNQLASVPATVGQLTALRHLLLNGNQLALVPSDIGRLVALQELRLGHNQLQSLPAALGKLGALTRLDLQSNRLVSLPTEIGRLTLLLRLYLNNNRLESVPAEIGELISLQTLSLFGNQLVSVPAALGKLSLLQELYLHNNQLASLPAEIGRLVALQELHLGGNQLAVVPNEIGQLGKLQRLTLNRNRLQSLPAKLGDLGTLRALHLDNNQLVSLPAEIEAVLDALVAGGTAVVR